MTTTANTTDWTQAQRDVNSVYLAKGSQMSSDEYHRAIAFIHSERSKAEKVGACTCLSCAGPTPKTRPRDRREPGHRLALPAVTTQARGEHHEEPTQRRYPREETSEVSHSTQAIAAINRKMHPGRSIAHAMSVAQCRAEEGRDL